MKMNFIIYFALIKRKINEKRKYNVEITIFNDFELKIFIWVSPIPKYFSLHWNYFCSICLFIMLIPSVCDTWIKRTANVTLQQIYFIIKVIFILKANCYGKEIVIKTEKCHILLDHDMNFQWKIFFEYCIYIQI